MVNITEQEVLDNAYDFFFNLFSKRAQTIQIKNTNHLRLILSRFKQQQTHLDTLLRFKI